MIATDRKQMARSLLRRRRRVDIVLRSLCLCATVIALLLLASILTMLIWKGLPALNSTVFTTITLPTGSNGGLLNAITGSLVQVIFATMVGTPIGLLVGTYLSEYADGSRLGDAVRFISDVLLSAPSILIGLFVYQLAVVPFGGFSGWAGICALAIIVIPIVIRTTEDMLRLQPTTLREAVIALGAPKWKMTVLICWRAARVGITTGALLAVARIAGETAPLLFTSLGNNGWNLDLSQPYSSLPVTIYAYAGSPYQDWIALAWAGALIVTFGVLGLNILARALTRQR
ncbi:MAG: phosphate ABC transporter permease PstA [Acetobacteraceae bacterium]|nr:phosphate ABC transporter permease PstA [Acetobacteraceae bacterium]